MSYQINELYIVDIHLREITVTVTSKGQITIPVKIRRLLGIKERDRMTFVIEDDETIRLRPTTYPNVRSLEASSTSKNPSMSWQEMRDIARAEALEDKVRCTR